MTILQLAEQICDSYCRFPYFESQEELDETCKDCPLNKMVEDEKIKEHYAKLREHYDKVVSA